MKTGAVKTRKKSKSNNYFSEKEMINYVKEYQLQRNDESFSKIAPSILELINGMINKQFSYNHHILNNKNDAIAECFIEIINSLNRYDPERGRLFAYLNRITKNTLMKYYTRSRRIKDKEKNYIDLIANIDDDDVDNDNIVMSSGMRYLNLYVDDLYDLNYNLKLNPSYKNVTLKVDNTINIIYKYLNNIKDIILYYVNDEKAISRLVDDITISSDIDFDFNYNNILISNKMFYTSLINNLYEFINKVLVYIERKYGDYINKDESNITYNGRWSNRAIGYVRRIIRSKLKKDNLARYYGVDNLVNFIQYLVMKRYEYDE